jgi:hypothetical protein
MFDGRQLVAHHHAHQIGAGEPDDGAPADRAALAHHGHPVAGFQDIFQAVADQNNASTTLLEPRHHGKQAGALFGRQYRGRFVKDQDAGATRQRLENLDLLLLPDG